MANHWGDFCTYCGDALTGEFPRKCSNGHMTYASPVTVGVALQPVQSKNGIGILVVQRGINPYKGEYALPGGFADQNESGQLTAPRELFEETHIKATSAVYFSEDIGGSHNDKDPRCHTMYFYAMNLLQEGDIDFNFHDEEVQTLNIAYLAADNKSLCDRNGKLMTLCFSTHHNAALNFLRNHA